MRRWLFRKTLIFGRFFNFALWAVKTAINGHTFGIRIVKTQLLNGRVATLKRGYCLKKEYREHIIYFKGGPYMRKYIELRSKESLLINIHGTFFSKAKCLESNNH